MAYPTGFFIRCEIHTLQAPHGTASQMALNRKRAQFKKWSKFARALKSKKALNTGYLKSAFD